MKQLALIVTVPLILVLVILLHATAIVALTFSTISRAVAYMITNIVYWQKSDLLLKLLNTPDK
jgi:hypothetical protein